MISADLVVVIQEAEGQVATGKRPTEKAISGWKETQRKGVVNYQKNKGKDKVSKWGFLGEYDGTKRQQQAEACTNPLQECYGIEVTQGKSSPNNSNPAKKPYAKIKRQTHQNDAEDEKWYRKMWNDTPEEERYCRECFAVTGKKVLYTQFNRVHIAHILGKGAHTKLRHVDTNWIFLCFKHHDQLDHGRKKEMKIWNFIKQQTFKLLKIEYPD